LIIVAPASALAKRSSSLTAYHASLLFIPISSWKTPLHHISKKGKEKEGREGGGEREGTSKARKYSLSFSFVQKLLGTL